MELMPLLCFSTREQMVPCWHLTLHTGGRTHSWSPTKSSWSGESSAMSAQAGTVLKASGDEERQAQGPRAAQTHACELSKGAVVRASTRVDRQQMRHAGEKALGDREEIVAVSDSILDACIH